MVVSRVFLNRAEASGESPQERGQFGVPLDARRGMTRQICGHFFSSSCTFSIIFSSTLPAQREGSP